MSHSPQQKAGSKRYKDAWRAINLLIRSDGSWSGHERNACYLNSGGASFQDISFVSGLDFDGDGRSFVPLDIDRDGDLDLILKFRTAPQIRTLRNDFVNDACSTGSPCPPRSLLIELSGRKSNHDAVGVRAILTTDQRRLLREVHSGSGFLSQPSRRLHFGLLPDETPESLQVRWPGGEVQEFSTVPQSGAYQIVEGKTELPSLASELPEPIKPEAVAGQTGNGAWLVDPVPAPEFSLDGLKAPKKLSDYRARKVLLNFWATWCPPCREELADLTSNADEFESAGIAVVTVSVDAPDDREKVKQFAAERNLPFPVLYADDRVVNTYTVLNRNLFDRRRDLGIPTSFLINETGSIVKVYSGATKSSVILADAESETGKPLPFEGRWVLSRPARDFGVIAAAMAERGLNDEARVFFETALEQGGSPEVYNNLATLLMTEGDLVRAEELLRKSLSLDANQVESRINLGSLLLRRGDAPQAIDVLEAARRLQPDDAFLHDALGSAYFQTGRAEDAERSYRQAIRLDPSVADYHYNLGSLLASTGHFAEALDSFEEARRLGRNDALLMTNLGVLYMETGRRGKALPEFQKAVELAPEDYGNRLNLAMYYLQSGDAGEARVSIERAKQIDPSRPNAYLLEAQLLAMQNKVSEAKHLLEDLIAKFPDFQPAQQMLRQLSGG